MAAHPSQDRVLELGRPDIVPVRVDRIDPATGRPRPLTLQSYPHATAVAGTLLDRLAHRGRGLLQATAALSDELPQAYGYPETGLITRAGMPTPPASLSALAGPSPSGPSSTAC
jgi:hypothetical protein